MVAVSASAATRLKFLMVGLAQRRFMDENINEFLKVEISFSGLALSED
jgi:hypothetical protein